jgi:hypothetical protein
MCDPPYGTTACKWDSVIPFEPMWEQLKRITKKNTTGFYVFAPYKKRDYIMLFNQSKLEENNYNIVGKQNNYLFKLKDLPGVIQKFMGVENSQNSGDNGPNGASGSNSSKLKIGNKKMIKMKKQKKQKK